MKNIGVKMVASTLDLSSGSESLGAIIVLFLIIWNIHSIA